MPPPGLKITGKVFAALWKDNLVVKRPDARVESLLSAGRASRFDPGMGRQMKGWAEVPPGAPIEWLALAQESHAFVSSG
jgi:hypothetical protein